MKKGNLLFLILLSFTSLLFSGCMKDTITKTYSIYTPVYMDKAQALSNIKSSAAQPLKNTGKIFLYGNYIFLNELNKGVHIINNTNPSSPQNVGFISIPGNVDIAVKGNTLYADLYTDLLAIDIANPLQARLSKTVPNIFPERQYSGSITPDSTKVIIDWIKKDTTVDVATGEKLMNNCPNCMTLQSFGNAGTVASAPSVGIAGSMSRFAIVNDYLYTVNMSSLGVFDIATTANPVKLTSRSIGWNIETVYPFKNKLFIGSSAGMFIFDITTQAAPVRQGQFNHARACDPVVADDTYAFVTLRAGTFCSGTNNQLDVINVSNVMMPTLTKTYPMTNPHGLAKDGASLFICDGKSGLKIYDASNVSDLKLIKHVSGLETFDAIAWNKKLIVVAKGGIYQYDYSDINNVRQVSKLATTQ